MNKKLTFFCLVFLTLFTISGCVQPIRKNDSRHYSQSTKSYSSHTNIKKHYEAVGVASWYGKQFHRKRTSSGERFNMYKLTAAHKTLPLSTYVTVTNLVNGRQVVVKVNDRGPFIRGRLIDLSYAAAKKLGMLGMGTAPVSIKSVA